MGINCSEFSRPLAVIVTDNQANTKNIDKQHNDNGRTTKRNY